jgi:GH15 family glucan-1,4-alpha-glucosidase
LHESILSSLVLISLSGVGGAEGTFTICTMWLIEALTRAAKYQTGLQAPQSSIKHKTHPHKQDYLRLARDMFENVTSFANHLGLFSEEIAVSGEQLGNTPQAFSHLAYVSAALNLERAKNE